jgi:hypothetical protein
MNGKPFVWPVLAVVICGCQTSDRGDLFNATTELVSSSCGPVVEVEDTETFQIRLTKDDDVLKWYSVETGDTMQGSVDEDELLLASVESIVLTEADATGPGCQVRRHDAYSGTISASSNKITKAEGTVVSSYTQMTGFNCDALIGTADGFTDLPCEIRYNFVATPAK